MSKVAFPKLHKAVKAALKKHKKQERDGTSPLPYITHPIDVLNLVRYVGHVEDEEVLCAAVLHDVVEETKWDGKDVADKFGLRVSALVGELTREEPNTDDLPDEEIWAVRTRTMLEEILRMSPEARLIKLADRCSNLQAALASKTGADLYRYIRQSQLILEAIPNEVSPALHQKAQTMAYSIDLPKKFKKLDPRAPTVETPADA